MKKKRKTLITPTSALLLMFCLPACGDGLKDWTWGEGVDLVAAAYCAKSVDCGSLEAKKENACVRHTVTHLCELEESCDVAQSKEDAETAVKCAKAIRDWGNEPCFESVKHEDAGPDERPCTKEEKAAKRQHVCTNIFFGGAPEECDAFWEIDPVDF